MNENELKRFAGQRFEKHVRVMTLWQTLAEHFYPERTDFTQVHNVGEELGIGLADSQPTLIRRDLGNSIESVTRDGKWFKMGIDGDPDHMGKMWLEYATDRQFKLMNQRITNFRRATKQGDHDYVTFGQNVISVQLNKTATNVIYRNWHLRDCAWWDNDEDAVDGLVRRWEPHLYELETFFGREALHPDVQKKLDDSQRKFDKCNIRHFDIPFTMYDKDGFQRFDRVSVYLDIDNEHLIQETGANHRTYVVPRFQTIAGSPYAYSPATVVGLPDARTLQAMTHTLLEAGERHARPPIIATEKVIRGDANFFSDGITYVSEEYDERLGAAVRPLQQDIKGFPYGLDMRNGIVEVLQAAFYVDKIDLPDRGGEMTAYEFSERMKQYRRQNLPLFTPIEHEYNGQLCEATFDILMSNGLFGSHQDIPESLKKREVVFKFESPLTAQEQEKKATMFGQVSQLLREASEFDQAVSANINFDESLRDAVEGTGAPMKWLNQVEDVAERRGNIEAMIAAEAENAA